MGAASRTLKSYELFARYVMPRFQGSLDTIRGSNEWARANRRGIFGPNVEAVRRAFTDAGRPVPEGFLARTAGARDVAAAEEDRAEPGAPASRGAADPGPDRHRGRGLRGGAGAPAASSRADAAELLPTDPALVTGTLANGLRYIVSRNQNPPGRVAIWLHVASGSLNESEDTRGLAHYLEHMAFNGSSNFPPGSLVPFFQSLGLTFGRDQNAFTSFDQTVYVLALPDTKPATLDRGLLYLSDVAFRAEPAARGDRQERQIILEEKRARASRAAARPGPGARPAGARVHPVGRRLPIGTEETIQAMGIPQFEAYYRRWYVPSNMTVIAVGDMDPAAVIEAIERAFGREPARRAPRLVRSGSSPPPACTPSWPPTPSSHRPRSRSSGWNRRRPR